MLVATRAPLQVGVVPWPGAPGTWTIVVKRSFELIERGTAPPAADTSSLGLDRTSLDGRVLHPTDFAPSKQECDVLVVGDQLLGPRGPVRLVAGELRKLAESAAPFGPRAGVGDSGDPMDPSLAGAWAAASFDPEAFQSAPRDQRIPRPRLPLDLVVDVVDQRFATRLEVTPPEAMFLDPSGWLPRVPIALRADTVTIDPRERLLSVVFRGLATAEGGARYYNSLFALNDEGAAGLRIGAIYDKHRLVPFGEYLPMGQLMSQIGVRSLVHVPSDFSAGPKPAPISLVNAPNVQPLICYESLYPGFTPASGAARPAWIVNVSNDAWFGATSGPRQHLNLASYRAIETGLAIARATPTGVSAMIDPWGRIVDGKRLDPGHAGVIDVRLPEPAAPTLYGRWGDGLFGLLLVLMLGGGLSWRRRKALA